MAKPTATANKMSMQPMAFPYFSTFIVSPFYSSITYSLFHRKKKVDEQKSIMWRK